MDVSNFNDEFEFYENNEISLKNNDYVEQTIQNPKYYLINNDYLLYIMSSNNTTNEYKSEQSHNMNCEEKYEFYEKKTDLNFYYMNLNIDLNEELNCDVDKKPVKGRKKIKIINRKTNNTCFSKIVKESEINQYFNNFLNQKRYEAI